MDDTKTPGRPAAIDLGDALVSGLIHEMRHPLLGIKAGLQLLAQQEGSALTSGEHWQMVAEQVARMEELFRTYQELFQHEPAPGVDFQVEPVVRRAVDLLRHRLGGMGRRFAYQPGAAGAVGHGAPQGVFHAVTNLIVNAIEAVEAAGDGRRIEVRVLPPQPDTGVVEVRVSDEGTGIAAGDRARIFTPHFTTKQTGTGLGLHLARTALAAHGGGLRLVEDHEAGRLPWARTEFSVEVAAARGSP